MTAPKRTPKPTIVRARQDGTVVVKVHRKPEQAIGEVRRRRDAWQGFDLEGAPVNGLTSLRRSAMRYVAGAAGWTVDRRHDQGVTLIVTRP